MKFLCKRGGSSGAGSHGGGGASASTPQQPTAPTFSATDDGPFRQMTDAEEAAYFAKQTFSKQEQVAINLYTDPNAEPGSKYNFAQNMNQAYKKGQPLTSIQQSALDIMLGTMHNIGYNAELTRYDHTGTVQRLMKHAGIHGDASNMTPSQLQGLIGQTFNERRLLSTSVNNFKNADDPSTFTTRQFKFTYRVKASAQAMMPGVAHTPLKGSGKATGDNFGEMLLGPMNSYKVVDIKYTGAKARAKGAPKTALTKDQIEIVVEVS